MKSTSEICFGIRAVEETIKAAKEIEKVFIKNGLRGELFNKLFVTIKELNIPFQFVPVEKLNRITRKNHQGIIAFISPVIFCNIENLVPQVYEKGEVPLFLILDSISDVRNFGAIVRTAECAAVNGIIISTKGSAQINSDSMKTSAGALNNMPICKSNNLKTTISFLKNCGIQICAATEKSDKIIYSADFNLPLAIIMGAEDKGIKKELLDLSDMLVKIPIFGNIESLNVSVAAGIILYEVLRQRNVN
ncbi:MAG: 23S rRNA (guanosine(2251)-2'-O)-methyltransferase RlmB [Bacteroidales bacterium]|nr:23S rRNA (guanosine(2251)-2'-O)-methyltransferase RlmB [Bacteroidales bacterium]